MKILFCGDVAGRPGRNAIQKYIPAMRREFDLDFVIVNGENAAAGSGITKKICHEFFEAGVDVITTGDHIWDQKETFSFIDQEKRLLRPLNLPENNPGKGWGVFQTAKGENILVINPMARVFMKPIDCPFLAVDKILESYPLGQNAKAIFVDFHGEATSEKNAMGYHLDGRVSAVVGTHTHIPTADTRILPSGTGYQSDAGMCGDYDSIIGVKKDEPLERFLRGVSQNRFQPTEGEAHLCGVLVETDEKTGLCTKITRIIKGPPLFV